MWRETVWRERLCDKRLCGARREEEEEKVIIVVIGFISRILWAQDLVLEFKDNLLLSLN